MAFFTTFLLLAWGIAWGPALSRIGALGLGELGQDERGQVVLEETLLLGEGVEREKMVFTGDGMGVKTEKEKIASEESFNDEVERKKISFMGTFDEDIERKEISFSDTLDQWIGKE